MQIFDTHAHLDMPAFAGDLEAVVARAQKAGVAAVLCVGTTLDASERCVELAARFPGYLHAAVGIHPGSWHEAGAGDMAGIARLARLPEVVAVGETGLDYHHQSTAPRTQLDGLRRHLELALEVDKPVIIHARKADEDVLAALAEAGRTLRGVRHCFDEGADLAGRYVEAGFHLAFGAAVTRPGHKRLKAAACAVPQDRMLLETDCPYQCPASRAGERNEPAYIVETVRALAELRDTTPEAVAAATTANARALFLGTRPV